MDQPTERSKEARLQDIVVPGWFHSHELYEMVADRCPPGAILVELGSYFGESTVYMASLLKELRKDAEFFSIDLLTWHSWMDGDDLWYLSSEKDREHALVKKAYGRDMRAIVEHYIAKYDVGSQVRLVQGDSIEAASRFEREAVEFVYLDTEHAYSRVRGEIEAWLPRVRNGGTIAGDDFDRDDDQDGGVKRAVTECFGRRFKTDGKTWYCVKSL